MELSERQQGVLDQLTLYGDIQIDKLAAIFEVTPQTIRRDVNYLCECGLARRVHGGVSLPTMLSNSTYQQRTQVESDIKVKIARRVAADIPEEATIMMGIGTSVVYVAQFLSSRQHLRVVTNNLQVARVLENRANIELYLAGGMIRGKHQDIIGQSVLRFFGDFEADIGIIGCGSITEKMVAMEHEYQEAEISRSILINSRKCWLLSDSSKWERRACVKVAGLEQLSRIYTNKANLPSELPIHQVVN
ncbi:Glycerol-3-phosphate regulon repressor [Vibrio thalassae]|uniref:Glycerol-3-phosphate regulon repressor n=1 Tax=Vibrio thalassae TaxID=1243014 RepID=A0A240EQ65_9VIBR|nr:DeoR/GlpR family DNA-binding transcription regulator [Vibrio thalassae]SNX50269.1 Glycerol-3-phosphate regulon repressor [Vibrio thalassae]